MRVELSRNFRFEAAHLLPRVPPGHKCARLHGHSFHFTVTIAGEVDEELGWLVDFAVLQDAVEPLRQALDHRYLNDIPGLENPTSERIAAWLWQRLENRLPLLSCITIEETCNSSCSYRGH